MAVSLKSIRESERHIPLTFWQRLSIRLKWIALHFSGTKIGTLLKVPKNVQEAYQKASGRDSQGGQAYDPDKVVEDLNKPVPNPVIAFHEALESGGDITKCSTWNTFRGQNLKVKEAWVFEGQVDDRGRLLTDPNIREAIRSPWPKPYQIKHIRSHEAYLSEFKRAKATMADQIGRSDRSREAVQKRLEKWRELREDGFIVGSDIPDNLLTTNFDPNQYTEYAPLMGGPFFRQLYIYDFLRQVSYAFEAWNHNPLAKGIIRILSQYALGRRFDVQIEDDQKRKIWEDYERRVDFTRMVCEYWGKECEIYGEFDYAWRDGIAIDPSTIWDIITDPDRVDIEYYAYQSYPTAYQMFTGYTVPGEPGAEKQAGSEYIIRQIPSVDLIRMKINCVSNEKRGRSSLFSILGWLKRIKDLYNAQVIREWLYSSFMWDVTLKNANQGDINAYVSANTAIPLPGSKNIHNDAVEIKALPALPSAGGGRGGSGIGEEVMCFIAVACGIPKEFLNIVSPSGGGSRAMALTAAEPFTKMVEDIQSRWEWFTTQVFKRVIEANGLKYKDGDIEVTFPSVTKDTTTETLKNIVMCEEMGYISHETAMNMAAKEMNITQFDADDMLQKIKAEQRSGVVQNRQIAPAGRFGQQPSDNPDDGQSEIHGQGKVNLSDQLKTL